MVYVKGHCGHAKIIFQDEICQMTSENDAKGERRVCLNNTAIPRTECEKIQEFTTTTTTTTEATRSPQELLVGGKKHRNLSYVFVEGSFWRNNFLDENL